MKIKHLCLIPARAGSKGIVGKNRSLIAGRPLIEWTMDVAIDCFPVENIFVSTDDPFIASIAQRRGLIVIQRKECLAGDRTPMLEVLKHGLSIMRPIHPEAKATVLLQPTSPLRTPGDVHSAVDLFDVSDSVWLASVSRVIDAHPSRMYRGRCEGSLGEKVWQEPIGNLRQDLESLYLRNGAIYIYDNESLEREADLTKHSPVLFEMPEERSKNIDTYLDLKIVEFILESRHAENWNT